MQVSKITLIIDSDFNKKVLELLPSCGILDFYSAVGRQNFLRKAIRFINPFTERYMVLPRQSDIFRFYVPNIYEKSVLSNISEHLALKTSGNGSIFAENAEVFVKNQKLYDEELLKKLPLREENNLFDYTLVEAIVQRDSADAISKNVLEMGYGVPAVCFGEGIGLRQKLGLLRIVVPANKEIMFFIVPPPNTQSLIDVVKKSAQLDTPGQGVILAESVRAMNVNIRIHLETQRHAATMDQIINSIDIMHGSTDWRSSAKSAKTILKGGEKHYRFVLITEEDSLEETIKTALEAGVGGATSVDYNGHFYDTEEKKLLSYQTKEGCEMIVKEENKKNVLKAIEESDFYGGENKGILEIVDVGYFYISGKNG
jgi:hypothetical protein